MKFKNLNRNKILVILLSSFIITSLSGCKNASSEDIPTHYYTIENTNENPSIESSSENIEVKPSTEMVEESTIQYSDKDLLAISEFEKIENEINEIIENDKNFLNEAKGVFITTVDFIFYDSEIGGVKFDDLTDEGKQKVLELSTSIDTKIENKYPNYKNEISDTATKALNKASEVIKTGASNINDFAKEKLGDENYSTLIETKDELVDYTKQAFDIIGDFSSELYNEGKQKVKDWYENFKNN